MSSPFLNVEKIVENEFAYAFYDGFPVSKGHTLIVPKRIVPEIFDLSDEEYRACFDLVKEVKDYLKKKYNPDGFNIGVNNGEDAGQSVFHAHIHVIPRYKGDDPNPRGGVRNIIPGREITKKLRCLLVLVPISKKRLFLLPPPTIILGLP